MFSVIQSPCIFEPLPMVNVFEGEQLGYSPEIKRRRGVLGGNRCHYARTVPKVSPVSMRYTVEETEDSYILSLFKKVSHEKISQAINHELSRLKESTYRPVYHIVRDFFGNPYYLEEEQDEKELLREAMCNLDMKAISRKVARELFDDLAIELNHRGDELTISSKKEDISKSFEIGEQIEDVLVKGCKLNESNEYGILKIVLKKAPKADLVKLLEWSNGSLIPAGEQGEKESSYFETKSAKLEKLREAQKAHKEELERQRIEEERLRKEAHDAESERQREEERLHKEAHDAEIERQRREEERLREEARLQEIKRQQKAAKAKKLKEKKAKLVAEKKARRLASQVKQKHTEQSIPSPRHVTININFNDENTNEQTSNIVEHGAPLKRISSPVLEDVEDEETDRFNDSLLRSPTGTSIIEEAV